MAIEFKLWAVKAAKIADDKKAGQISLLDVRKVSSIADFMMIATVEGGPHMRAVREAVRMELKTSGLQPLHMDGEGSDRWAVIDFGGLIVHLMSPEARDFYRLESLWRDARHLDWGGKPARKPAAKAVTKPVKKRVKKPAAPRKVKPGVRKRKAVKAKRSKKR